MLQKKVLTLVMFVVCSEAAPSSPALDAKPSQQSPSNVDTKETITTILNDIKSWQAQKRHHDRPFVTLTFAQSLDGKIALKTSDSTTSSNLPLSGSESLLLTHGLRSIHDAILVGGKTLSTDNPQLSNRLWGQAQPRPVVLDTRLEHIKHLGSKRRAQNVIVCCSYKAAESYKDYKAESIELLPCQCDDDGRLLLSDVLKRLGDSFGIASVMVEGGASVHSAFLSERLVDCLCITIVPKIIGDDRGLASFSSISSSSMTQQEDFLDLSACSNVSRFIPLGNDCIYICQWL